MINIQMRLLGTVPFVGDSSTNSCSLVLGGDLLALRVLGGDLLSPRVLEGDLLLVKVASGTNHKK